MDSTSVTRRRSSRPPTVDRNGGNQQNGPQVRIVPASNDDAASSRTGRSLASRLKIPSVLKATLCTFEPTRDFLARERTFFSWLRLSTTLMILSGALFLRLQLQDTSRTPTKPALTLLERRAIRAILRERLSNFSSNALLEPVPGTDKNASLLNTVSLDQAASTAFSPQFRDSPFPFSPNLSGPSIAYGTLFAIMSFLALSVGLYDFLRCSRCLEQFDHFGAIQCSEGFGHGPGGTSGIVVTGTPTTAQAVAGGPVVTRPTTQPESGLIDGYDAAQAVEAHSGRVVHVTQMLVATSIAFVAVIFVLDEFLK
ncbi:hypothetical protein OC845_005650 [Tilletia horrida]|nr:hypothetical protein OC845_005650 [Tilletia horrida]